MGDWLTLAGVIIFGYFFIPMAYIGNLSLFIIVVTLFKDNELVLANVLERAFCSPAIQFAPQCVHSMVVFGNTIPFINGHPDPDLLRSLFADDEGALFFCYACANMSTLIPLHSIPLFALGYFVCIFFPNFFITFSHLRCGFRFPALVATISNLQIHWPALSFEPGRFFFFATLNETSPGKGLMFNSIISSEKGNCMLTHLRQQALSSSNFNANFFTDITGVQLELLSLSLLFAAVIGIMFLNEFTSYLRSTTPPQPQTSWVGKLYFHVKLGVSAFFQFQRQVVGSFSLLTNREVVLQTISDARDRLFNLLIYFHLQFRSFDFEQITSPFVHEAKQAGNLFATYGKKDFDGKPMPPKAKGPNAILKKNAKVKAIPFLDPESPLGQLIDVIRQAEEGAPAHAIRLSLVNLFQTDNEFASSAAVERILKLKCNSNNAKQTQRLILALQASSFHADMMPLCQKEIFQGEPTNFFSLTAAIQHGRFAQVLTDYLFNESNNERDTTIKLCKSFKFHSKWDSNERSVEFSRLIDAAVASEDLQEFYRIHKRLFSACAQIARSRQSNRKEAPKSIIEKTRITPKRQAQKSRSPSAESH